MALFPAGGIVEIRRQHFIELGKGGMGVVYLAVRVADASVTAVKTISMTCSPAAWSTTSAANQGSGWGKSCKMSRCRLVHRVVISPAWIFWPVISP
jgi:hypothetical protein